MKTVLSLVMAVFLSMSVVEQADAKRFGSGGFGKAFKTSPFKKASPQKAAPQKAAPANGSNLAGNKAAGRKPGMGGLMGGLLAGGMFAYLLGSGAFEGIQFMDILLFALLGFVLFKVFAGRKRSAVAYSQGGPSGSQAHSQAFESLNSGMGSDSGVPMDLPASLDVKGFTDRALDHYKLVHKAWDHADMSTVKEYLHEGLYDQMVAERKGYTELLRNEVLDLSADVVRSEATQGGYVLSVLFRGRVKDLDANQEQGIYDVWHLEQVNDGPWLIIGIEAE